MLREITNCVDIFGPLPSVVVVFAYFPFNVNLAFIVEKLSADHEICWLPVFCFAVIENIAVIHLYL